MRKSKIVEEPQLERKRILHWKCPSCQTWVDEEMAMRCASCQRKTKGKTPKMFSDLTDMFGH